MIRSRKIVELTELNRTIEKLLLEEAAKYEKRYDMLKMKLEMEVKVTLPLIFVRLPNIRR